VRVLDLQSLTSGIGALAVAEKDHRTPIATAMLATKFSAPEGVTAGGHHCRRNAGQGDRRGSALLLGDRLLRKVQVEWVHRIAAAVFAAIGVAMLLGLQA
jgi:putative Ca2+/H+ antiporter (TMEM165/GDT1 family)